MKTGGVFWHIILGIKRLTKYNFLLGYLIAQILFLIGIAWLNFNSSKEVNIEDREVIKFSNNGYKDGSKNRELEVIVASPSGSSTLFSFPIS